MKYVVLISGILVLIVVIAGILFVRSERNLPASISPAPQQITSSLVSSSPSIIITPSVSNKPQQVKIFLISLGDNGVSGPKVGCGDSVVGVEREIPQTQGVLHSAIEQLISLKERTNSESGLYSPLYQSNLKVEKVTVTDGKAVIRLTGSLQLGGECDDPRVKAQFEQTALQFPTVKEVLVLINGKPLDQLLSGKGE